MKEQMFIVGISLMLGTFALKAGLGSAAGRFGIKQISSLIAVYIALFITFGWIWSTVPHEIISAKLAPALQSGIALHIIMAAGMGIWGWVLLRANRKADWEQEGPCSVPKRRKHTSNIAAWLVVLPCPVCATAIFFSISLAIIITGVSPWKIVSVLMTIFLTVTVLIYLISKKRLATPDALGFLCLFISGYFLLSLAIGPAYAKAADIYMLAREAGAGPNIPVISSAAIIAATVILFAFGIVRAMRKFDR